MAQLLFLTSNGNFITFFLWVFILILCARGETSLNFFKIGTTRHGTRDLKYVLLWTREDYYPFYVLGEGQSKFSSNGCPVANCYVTSNRQMFNGDITKFDAVAFNGRNIAKSDLPKKRSPHQKFIFFNTESAQNFPVCDDIYDNFFNWTATYRLDSEIQYRYISIKNAAGEIVGPKLNMKWMIKRRLKGKTYTKLYLATNKKTTAAAWFVSNCDAKSDRMNFAKKLQEQLELYHQTLHIYGNCGTKVCHRGNPKCDAMLREKYYFYLSLENSHNEDYVTEKLLTAVTNFIIPVVYGGANYSRFLPPSSFIDGNTMTPQDIAAHMHHLIQSPRLYLDYMWWKDYYSYHKHQGICLLCAALNNKTMLKYSVYKDFRKWWYPQYKDECN